LTVGPATTGRHPAVIPAIRSKIHCPDLGSV